MKSKIFTKISRFFGGGTRCQHSEKEAVDGVKTTPVTEEFERCVMCGAQTYIPISMPIDWRENYEIGCGQLCVDCAKMQREEMGWAKDLSNEQILQAVEQSIKESKE